MAVRLRMTPATHAGRENAAAYQGGRHMKPVRHVTTVVMLAALAAAGCSKHNESSAVKKGSTGSEIAKQTESQATRGTAGESPVAATATITTSSSFADGETAYAAKKY